jgi:hypothetical protein
MVRTGQDRALSLFYHIWECDLYGGYEMETHHSNTRLSIYGMGDTPAFVIKGYMPTFVMEDGMGDASAFMIKGDVPPRNMCLIYLHNRRHAIGTCISLLSEKYARLEY